MRSDRLVRLIGRPAEMADLPVTLAYPPRELGWETFKGCLGMGACFGLVGLLQPSIYIAVPVGGFGLLFLFYTIRQIRRRSLSYVLDESGITRGRGDNRQVIPWPELQKLLLNFYPVSRRGSAGMLVLILNGGPGPFKFKLDSTIGHFPILLDRAAGAARERKLPLDPTTEANLDHLEL